MIEHVSNVMLAKIDKNSLGLSVLRFEINHSHETWKKRVYWAGGRQTWSWVTSRMKLILQLLHSDKHQHCLSGFISKNTLYLPREGSMMILLWQTGNGYLRTSILESENATRVIYGVRKRVVEMPWVCMLCFNSNKIQIVMPSMANR